MIKEYKKVKEILGNRYHLILFTYFTFIFGVIKYYVKIYKKLFSACWFCVRNIFGYWINHHQQPVTYVAGCSSEAEQRWMSVGLGMLSERFAKKFNR